MGTFEAKIWDLAQILQALQLSKNHNGEDNDIPGTEHENPHQVKGWKIDKMEVPKMTDSKRKTSKQKSRNGIH